MQLTPGKRVELEFNSEWHPACIVEADEDGLTCTARYEDGRDEEVGVDVRSRIRPRVRVSDLQVGQEVEGTVANIVDYGFFLDIGAERNGLVHKSKIVEEWVESACVHLFVRPGEVVQAWVLPGLEEGKLAFTMVKFRDGTKGQRPDNLLDFEQVHFREWLDGEVSGVLKKSLLVLVRHPVSGAVVRGRVPAHEMPAPEVNLEDLDTSLGNVAARATTYEVGDQVKVRVMGIDANTTGQMFLSMQKLREDFI